jgi:nucleotide-binding universal stress UspA family protein
MYKTILITLECKPTDQIILQHVTQLAKLCGSSIVLLHVADGWAARHFGKDAISREITEDTAYLDSIKRQLEAEGIPVQAELAYGEPRAEILKWINQRECSLIAMSTHGHKFLGDLLLGATASHVQHRVNIPVLLIRAK